MIDRSAQVLIVDDEVAMVRSLELLIRPQAQVTKAYSVPEVEELIDRGKSFDCVITDISMPEASGLSLLSIFKKRKLDIPVIVMTAYSSVPQAVEAIQAGAFEYLVKPFENADMVSAVKKAISKKGITYGVSKSVPGGWICNSVAMKELLQKAERAVESNAVLILGEIGVGKSRMARWLHEQSGRSKKEFVVVDGRSHVEDSILSSKNIKKGGTLFISEIFSLSRALQDRVMEAKDAGSLAVIASATRLPLLENLSNFREDLYQNMASVVLRIPSLKERKDDLEGLIHHCVSSLSEKLKIPELRVDAAALEKIMALTLPGNIRELEQILERAAIEARSGLIGSEEIIPIDQKLENLLPFTVPIENGWNRLQALYQSMEKELIDRALVQYPDYSNSQIAVILGTTRRILELRMKEYKIRET